MARVIHPVFPLFRAASIMRDGDFDEEEGRSVREGIWISGWKICSQIGEEGVGRSGVVERN